MGFWGGGAGDKNRRGRWWTEWCLVNERYEGAESRGGLWPHSGVRQAIEAEPLAGRLRQGGAGQPAGSQGAKEPSGRRGPGQAGRQGRWGGSYLGLCRGGHHSPFLFCSSRFPPSVSRVRPDKNSRGRGRRGSDGSARVGPAALGSERAASAHPPPCHRDSARPGQAHPPPHPA